MSQTFLVLSALVGTGILLWGGQRYLEAAGHARASDSRLSAVAHSASELDRLRRAAPAESRRERPAAGTATRVAQVAALCGLTQATLQDVTPEMEIATSRGLGIKYGRTAVRLTLDPVTLPEVGRFLHRWRETEPVWTVSAIDLNPSSSHAVVAQKPFRATLLIETVFAARPGTKDRTLGAP